MAEEPRLIVITWTPGKPLELEYVPADCFDGWEVEAALTEALHVVADETVPTEGEDSDG